MGRFYSWQDAAQTGWGKKDYEGEALPFTETQLVIGCLQWIADALGSLNETLGVIAKRLAVLDPDWRKVQEEKRKKHEEWKAWEKWVEEVMDPVADGMRKRLIAFLSPRDGKERAWVRGSIGWRALEPFFKIIRAGTESGGDKFPSREEAEAVAATFDPAAVPWAELKLGKKTREGLDAMLARRTAEAGPLATETNGQTS